MRRLQASRFHLDTRYPNVPLLTYSSFAWQDETRSDYRFL